MEDAGRPLLAKETAVRAFQASKRHRRFPQFLVQKYLSGAPQEINERTIGTEVFHRVVAEP
jgi:hypothetical protein